MTAEYVEAGAGFSTSLRRNDARREHGFEMLGAVAIGVGEEYVRDAAELLAQCARGHGSVELGALPPDRLNGVDVVRDQIRWHGVEIRGVFDDAAQALGGGTGGREPERGGVALDVVSGAKQLF